MRKQDIKPGVIYAYQRGRGNYDSPKPIVFLAAPTDGQLYDEPRRYGSGGAKPAFVRCQAVNARPGHSSIYGPTGYPAVLLGSGAPTDTKPESLLALTIADFEAATSAYRSDGTEFMVITSLAAITGTYAEAVAAHEAERRARDEQRQRESAARDRSQARATAVIAALARAGIKADPASAYGTAGAITITLDEAEKLTVLVGKGN